MQTTMLPQRTRKSQCTSGRTGDVRPMQSLLAGHALQGRDPAQADENLYRYCENEPTQATDPSGLAEQPAVPATLKPEQWVVFNNSKPIGYVSVSASQGLSPALALGCTDPNGKTDVLLSGSSNNPNAVFLPAGWKLTPGGVVKALFGEKVLFKWRSLDLCDSHNEGIDFEQWASGSATINGQTFLRNWAPDGADDAAHPGAFEIQQFGDGRRDDDGLPGPLLECTEQRARAGPGPGGRHVDSPEARRVASRTSSPTTRISTQPNGKGRHSKKISRRTWYAPRWAGSRGRFSDTFRGR